MLIGSAVLALGVIGVVAYNKLRPADTSLPKLVATGSGSGSGIDAQPAAPTRVSAYPEGSLIRQGSDDKVYVIDALGYRHWISTRGYFDAHKYRMSDVKSISAQEMAKIPEASPLAGMAGLRN